MVVRLGESSLLALRKNRCSLNGGFTLQRWSSVAKQIVQGLEGGDCNKREGELENIVLKCRGCNLLATRHSCAIYFETI